MGNNIDIKKISKFFIIKDIKVKILIFVCNFGEGMQNQVILEYF